ncbi:MAG: XTP/dITP diphosphohydrolase [Candidatus Poseidoniaceae archaeon]|jgi:XTP/dITP diphosphohydrolase|tara:strand:+ start:188 stop:853 length:666 start_codon:yes stop_codon:yes gene_type:complete
MMRTIWFLTGNIGKLKEATYHLQPLGYTVRQLIVKEGALIEPQADTLEEVAQSKIAQALSHLPGGEQSEDMILVEDAGLFIEALNGFPGVYSAYALKTIGNNGILRLLQHLQSQDTVQCAQLRSAEFQAVAALWMNGKILYGNGKCPGWIALESSEGEGFGFDPVFTPNDLDSDGEPLPHGEYGEKSTHGKTFGALSLEEKQAYSHRSRALNDLLRQLPSS